MPSIRNEEPFGGRTSLLAGSWHPNFPSTDAEQRALDWECEHARCYFCLETFHVDQLEKVECEGGELGCPECRAYIASGEGDK